jgi:conjugal transfer pilus assembly protein TraV
MRTGLLPLITLLMMGLVTGCASDATRSVTSTDELSVVEALQQQQRDGRPAVTERDMATDGDGRILAETTEVAVGPVLPRPQGPVPLRLPAQIMRVWIAPWEDSTGNLHAPGYVYTEIEPRRWSIGHADSRVANTVLAPLQVEDRSGTATK